MAAAQTFQNHARIVPAFHYGVFLPLLVNFGWQGYRLFHGISGETVVGLLVSVALILMAFSIRGQVLTVQDRVIRLESKLRMREVLPAELAARASTLSVKQLVALRFAGDDELPSLVSDVLAGKVTEPKAIKQAITRWQADHLRA